MLEESGSGLALWEGLRVHPVQVGISGGRVEESVLVVNNGFLRHRERRGAR